MSEKMMVPPNTRKVPNQWTRVKGFWKYQMEKRSERNFLTVTTRVTVRLAHSLVRIKTLLIQIHWVMMLPRSQSIMLGTARLMTGMVIG